MILNRFGERARQAIELGDHQGIAVADELEHGLQLRAVGRALSAHLLLEDALDASGLKLLALGVGILIDGTHATVRNAHRWSPLMHRAD
jgi:hypothetical protein